MERSEAYSRGCTLHGTSYELMIFDITDISARAHIMMFDVSDVSTSVTSDVGDISALAFSAAACPCPLHFSPPAAHTTTAPAHPSPLPHEWYAYAKLCFRTHVPSCSNCDVAAPSSICIDAPLLCAAHGPMAAATELSRTHAQMQAHTTRHSLHTDTA